MAFLIDNPLYVINTILMNIKFKNNNYTISEKSKNKTVTALIPAKHENYDTIYETINSVNAQTIKPEKIILLLNYDDISTYEEAKKIKDINFEIKQIICSSKADALNISIKDVKTSHVFIVDVGDILENESFLEKIISDTEDDADACISLQVPKNGHWFVKDMMKYEFENWKNNLRKMYNNYNICPLPGTGLLMRTDFIKNNKFPETLAEDAAIGLNIGKVNFTDAKLYYDIPESLIVHLKQRARWYAGYLQNYKYAKTLFGKWLCATPIINGLATLSIIFTPISMVYFHYGFPWNYIDMMAGINLLIYMTYMVIKFKQPKLYIMTPVWWFVTGISFYISLYYLWTGKWFKSPKTALL